MKPDDTIEVQTLKRIWLKEDDVYLEIGDGEDGLGIELRPGNTEKCREWFGNFSLVMDEQLAYTLAKALVEVVESKKR